jgi:hypothetical protein
VAPTEVTAIETNNSVRAPIVQASTLMKGKSESCTLWRRGIA